MGSDRAGRLVALALAWSVAGACGQEASQDSSTAAEAPPPAAAPASAAATGPDTVGMATPCIRGGTPRGDVSRIMGEPDSVVFGSWFYGSSEILFGYGVVVEIRDRGELILCDRA